MDMNLLVTRMIENIESVALIASVWGLCLLIFKK